LLVQWPSKRRDRGVNVRPGERGDGARMSGLDGTPRAIERGSADAQRDFGLVLFFCARQKLRQARRPAEHQRQDAGGQRIERARMAHLFAPGGAARHGHNIMRCRPLGLVDNEHPVGKHRGSPV
jgi:hypothetical protein